MPVIHELYGIQSEQLETARLEYRKVLDLLIQLKRGVIEIEQVEIEGNGWKVNEKESPLSLVKEEDVQG